MVESIEKFELKVKVGSVGKMLGRMVYGESALRQEYRVDSSHLVLWDRREGGGRYIESKYSIKKSMDIMYIQYIILLIYPLQSTINYIGINTNVAFIKMINRLEIGNGLMYTMFQLMFLTLLFLSVKKEEKNIIEFEDEEKAKKVSKNLIKYKVFTALNIIVLTVLILLTKDKTLLMPSILLILSSMSIHYSKEL